MTITLNSASLKAALGSARLVAQRQSAMPMYGMVVLQALADSESLTITASSVEAQIALDVDANVEAPLDLCVDADRLALALNVPGETTKLSMDGDRLKIATGRSVFRLPHQPSQNFPLLLTKGEKVATFECSWLAGAIRRVLPFTGTADYPAIYQRGVSVAGNGGKVRIEGTTGATAAYVERSIDEKGAFSVMLPRRVCEMLDKLAPTRAILKQGSVVFLGGDMQLVSSTLQGVMPDTRKAYPGDDAKRVTVPRKAFIDAVKSVAAMTDVLNKRFKVVRFESDGAGSVVITATGQEGDGRADVATSSESDAVSGLFDAGYIAALVADGDADDVTLLFGSPPSLSINENGLRAVVAPQRG